MDFFPVSGPYSYLENPLGAYFDFPSAFVVEIQQTGDYLVTMSADFVLTVVPPPQQLLQLALTDSGFTPLAYEGRQIDPTDTQGGSITLVQTFRFTAGQQLRFVVEAVASALPGTEVINANWGIELMQSVVGAQGAQGAQGPIGAQGSAPAQIRALARYNVDATGSVGPAGGWQFDPTTTVPGPVNIPWTNSTPGLALATPFEEDPDGYFTMGAGGVLTFNIGGKYRLSTGQAILSTETLAPVGSQLLHNGQSVFAAAPGCGSFSNQIPLAGTPVAGIYPYAYSLGCDTLVETQAGDTVAVVLYAGGGAGGLTSECAQASNFCVQLITDPGVGPQGPTGPIGAQGPQGPAGPPVDAWLVGGNTHGGTTIPRLLATETTILALSNDQPALTVGGTAGTRTRPTFTVEGTYASKLDVYTTNASNIPLPAFDAGISLRQSNFGTFTLPAVGATGAPARILPIVGLATGASGANGIVVQASAGNNIVQGGQLATSMRCYSRTASLAIELPGYNCWAMMTTTSYPLVISSPVNNTPDASITPTYYANLHGQASDNYLDTGAVVADSMPNGASFSSGVANFRITVVRLNFETPLPVGATITLNVLSAPNGFPALAPSTLIKTGSFGGGTSGIGIAFNLTEPLLNALNGLWIRLTNTGTLIPTGTRFRTIVTGWIPGY